MYLIRLKVQGYRSLYEEPPLHDGRVATDVPATFDDAPGVEIRLDRLTVLIGCNDTGKSSVLDLIDIVLNRGQPDVDDFHRPLSAVAGHEANLVSQPVDTIEVHLEFQVEGERDADVNTFAVDGLLLLRIVYTPVGVETHYLGPTPVDQRLGQEFDKMKAHDQIELIRDLDATALDGLSNIPQRAQWLENFSNAAPRQLSRFSKVVFTF
jgi:hypothetical protein